MYWLWVIFTLCAVLGGILFWSNKESKNYVKELGIPFVRSTPLLFLYSLIKVFIKGINLAEIENERYKKYGALYGSSEGIWPVISIADPKILRKILIKDFHAFPNRRSFTTNDPIADSMVFMITGEDWKRIRTIITPTFTTGRIKKMTDIIIDSAKNLIYNFITKSGQPIDGKKFFNAFAMDVIASTAFGTKIHSYQDPNNRFLQETNRIFLSKLAWRIILRLLSPKLATFFNVGMWPPKTMKFFKEETLKIIADRKKTGKTKNDFLQLLLDAEKCQNELNNGTQRKTEEYTDDKNAIELGHEEETNKNFQAGKKYKSLSHDELIAQCITFFINGFETTATTLTCIFYTLAVYPEIQEKLRKEVDEVILKHGGKLTYDAIQEMKYLDIVITETLRMYPPLIRAERVAEIDYEVEELGITIRKGTLVTIPIYAIQNDPRYYPEPDVFRPERFEAKEKSERDPISFLAFGAGPRNCVAMRFALMEIKLCIAYAVSQIEVKRCSETQVPLKVLAPLGMIKPDVKFAVQERSHKVFV